jgi:hypothetical protein
LDQNLRFLEYFDIEGLNTNSFLTSDILILYCEINELFGSTYIIVAIEFSLHFLVENVKDAYVGVAIVVDYSVLALVINVQEAHLVAQQRKLYGLFE